MAETLARQEWFSEETTAALDAADALFAKVEGLRTRAAASHRRGIQAHLSLTSVSKTSYRDRRHQTLSAYCDAAPGRRGRAPGKKREKHLQRNIVPANRAVEGLPPGASRMGGKRVV